MLDRPHLFDELHRCRDWIQAALAHGGHTHDFEDIVRAIYEGRMQLWAGERGCIVTEIVTYPRKKVLHVFLGGTSTLTWKNSRRCRAAKA